ncbi:MAG: glycosyltransferase family 4 protein [Acidobacteria bacterium]|nr:glycosyltransferase family 4 protein [Acidobacteriota bacterium]
MCLVSHYAFASLSGTARRPGGVERQTSLLARWLAGRGHRVSMITWDEGQPDGIRIDGVRVLRLCRENEGWPVVRFVHPRWTSLLQALRAADADVYYQNCAECVTGQVALWCRANRRPFVYSAASDADCDARLPLMPHARERVLYRAGLRRADRIIVQTRAQREMLRANFGRDGIVMPLPCPGPMAPPPGRAARRRLLWVGRICEVKRPDRLLDLAERCPDLVFDLVGPPDGSAYAAGVLARAGRLTNVRVHGGLERARIFELLAEALCLCATSEIEGFPNTFLEAWSHGVPVVTTVDPDRTIAREELGFAVGDACEMERCVRRLVDEPATWERISRKAEERHRRVHAPDAVMPRFEALLAGVVSGAS